MAAQDDCEELRQIRPDDNELEAGGENAKEPKAKGEKPPPQPIVFRFSKNPPLFIGGPEDLQNALAQHLRWLDAVAAEAESKRELHRANLSGANLTAYDLSGCRLSGANLSTANLSGCVMVGADLRAANLEGADLRGCNLVNANLRRARLARANLRGATLTGSDLRHADMAGADLTDAATDGMLR